MKLSIWWPTYGNSIRMGRATSRMGGATSFLYPALLRVSKLCLMRPGNANWLRREFSGWCMPVSSRAKKDNTTRYGLTGAHARTVLYECAYIYALVVTVYAGYNVCPGGAYVLMHKLSQREKLVILWDIKIGLERACRNTDAMLRSWRVILRYIEDHDFNMTLIYE